MLHRVALGFAIAEADHKIREENPNDSTRIREYLANSSIPVPAPWCAAFVQFCSDRAAQAIVQRNPLDDVRREALVADYVEWAKEENRIVEHPEIGDLAAFDWKGDGRWDHIGFVSRTPNLRGSFWCVEGNTRGEGGEGVHNKPRSTKRGYNVCFISWGR